MKIGKFKLIILALALFGAFLFGKGALAQESTEQKLQRLSQEIGQYEKEIVRLQTQANTLNNQIAQYDAQIRLTTLKITQVEEKILILGGRIDQLEVSLTALTDAFSNRAVETYKMARLGDAFLMLVAAPDLNGAVSRFHYLQKIQEADRDLLIRLQEAQTSYVIEKESQEDLQRQLTEEKAKLASQKSAKAELLRVTRNDEKKYQELLAQARSELEAIQAILAGKGTESQVGHVNEGERIASVIQGASCNSSGTHTHFIVSSNGVTQNPFSYLRSGVSYENCSGPYCGSPDGDPFNPGGSWNWPMNPSIKFNQGYGVTWAVRNTWAGSIYSFHNGLDFNGASSEVKAVRAGTLYRGSYIGGSGCSLRYVRVDHDENELDTFYLHVNY